MRFNTKAPIGINRLKVMKSVLHHGRVRVRKNARTVSICVGSQDCKVGKPEAKTDDDLQAALFDVRHALS